MSTTDSPLVDKWRRPRPSGPSLRKGLWVTPVLAGATALSVSLTRSADVFTQAPASPSTSCTPCSAPCAETTLNAPNRPVRVVYAYEHRVIVPGGALEA
ncbi:hypothetical protein [Cryobacterium ruanii]|uniref:Uncharacterized protein n=1 Tax=Cryobacterium ruanii TaxID=1259197 RepID=A0A4R9ALQ3_9MICO|nr:hypothetical protein [Cryobacterium ruanii]TFD64349.1 hypothetical protein E3T47_12845 [Cryobacterium ruanii]